jgi:cytochrome c peroxidase
MPKIILLFAFLIISGSIFYSGSKFFPYNEVGLKSVRVDKPDFNLTPKEELGKNLFFDKIASPNNMSCADCHGPEVGFTGPTAEINAHGAVYPGAVPQRFGTQCGLCYFKPGILL